MSPEDLTYALENTRVIVEPRQAIATFGQTSFDFQLVTEPMDEVGTVCIRSGQLHAERPRILAPDYINKILLEGFGEQAREFADLFTNHPEHFKILRYGFVLKKKDFSKVHLKEPKETTLERLQEQIAQEERATTVLIEGVDDGWEACLLKFTMELIQRSAGENIGEWKKRGFIQ
jgi:hypothetical protein